MGLRRSRGVYSQIYSGRSLSITYRMNEHHAPNVCITCAVHTDFFILKFLKKGGSLFCADTRSKHKHAERDDRSCGHVPSS